MKIYVASKFSNQEVVRAAHRLLEADKHTITVDWTAFDDTHLLRAVADAKSPDAKLDAEKRLGKFRAHCAQLDLDGVIDADVVMLFAVDGMKGAWIELGVAMCGRRCIERYPTPELLQRRPQRLMVIGMQPQHFTVFLDLPYVEHYKTFEDARKALRPPRPPPVGGLK